MGLNDTTNPRTGELTIRVRSGSQSVEFTRFLAYSCREQYLEASAVFEFTLDQRELSTNDLAVLVAGATVQVLVDGNLQMTGIIDEPAGTFSSTEGNVVHVCGRDWLSVAVDNQIDPQVRFVPSMSLLDLIIKAYSTIDPQITVVADDIANRNVITGLTRGETSTAESVQAAQNKVNLAENLTDTPENRQKLAFAQSQLQQAQNAAFATRQRTSKKGKPSKHFILGREKPYPNEGLFAFTSRVAQRFGLWIRPYVDGQTIVVAAPDFDQSPRYGICHAFDARRTQNNVVRGHFAPNRRDQPSIIYAAGIGGGGDFAKSRLRAGIINPAVQADNSAVISAYADVPLLDVDPITAAFPPFIESAARPAFLFDNESHTQDQLHAYLRRELSLRLRKALTARYEIMGHMLNGQPVAVNTIASVLDQQPIANWNGPLWVLARDFRKTPHEGSRTNLDLILPGSLQF
jgi:prophage tail gpP-like protein